MSQIKFLVLVSLVTAPAIQAFPKPQLQNGHMVPTGASEAKEYQYEEQRDHDLQESINGGQSGWALYLISEGGNPQDVITSNKPKRHDIGIPHEHPQTNLVQEPALEPSNLPESYAGRFTGSAIALANKLAGAQKQAIGKGEVSYGRKKRHDIEVPIFYEPAQDTPKPQEKRQAAFAVATQFVTSDEQPRIGRSSQLSDRLKGSAIAKANQLAGAQSQATSSGTSYGRKKRHDTGIPHEHPHPEPVQEPAQEPSNLPESYAGRFTGSAIALANRLAGAMKQAIGKGEVSYGRKKRHDTGFPHEHPEPVQEPANLPDSYAGRFDGSAVALANKLAGAQSQATSEGTSYGRKRRSDAASEVSETAEEPSEALLKSMNDQMDEIENIQALWLDFLQHGISSRRKRQSVKHGLERALDKEVKVELPESMADQMAEIQNVQELWLEFLQHGISSRRRRQTVEQALEIAKLDESILQDIFPTSDQINSINDDDDELDQLALINDGSLGAITEELRIKSWGETGHNVPQLS